jgi:hypothetical protein
VAAVVMRLNNFLRMPPEPPQHPTLTRRASTSTFRQKQEKKKKKKPSQTPTHKSTLMAGTFASTRRLLMSPGGGRPPIITDPGLLTADDCALMAGIGSPTSKAPSPTNRAQVGMKEKLNRITDSRRRSRMTMIVAVSIFNIIIITIITTSTIVIPLLIPSSHRFRFTPTNQSLHGLTCL